MPTDRVDEVTERWTTRSSTTKREREAAVKGAEQGMRARKTRAKNRRTQNVTKILARVKMEQSTTMCRRTDDELGRCWTGGPDLI